MHSIVISHNLCILCFGFLRQSFANGAHGTVPVKLFFVCAVMWVLFASDWLINCDVMIFLIATIFTGSIYVPLPVSD